MIIYIYNDSYILQHSIPWLLNSTRKGIYVFDLTSCTQIVPYFPPPSPPASELFLINCSTMSTFETFQLGMTASTPCSQIPTCIKSYTHAILACTQISLSNSRWNVTVLHISKVLCSPVGIQPINFLFVLPFHEIVFFTNNSFR